jgi:hypothetical protein
MGTVLGVDAGSPTLAEAEHLLLDLAGRLGAGPGAVLCTHAVRTAQPHYAVSMDLPGQVEPAVLTAVLAALLPADGAAAVTERGRDRRHGTVDGLPEAQRSARAVAADHRTGAAGRAVRFPGVDVLTGRLPVTEVLARTAIDEVVVLGGPPAPAAGTVLDTRDFVRPEWSDGRLTLLVLPAGAGLVAPFEVPCPTPCCATHG